ncbi:MAG: methyl-accepting chemotaxis protein [Elusimicrobia bacterium]|nr:methyl-accepting chemotaxis protein [Elusimicrobiota bacterium]
MRKRLYIDPELQFPLVLSLILLVTGQALFVGWGFYKAVEVARQWDRADQAYQFFKVLLLTIVPVVGVNFAAGLWISNKIAGPLARIRRALSEISRGDLEQEITTRNTDLLQTHVQELNRMAQTLRRLIYRDRGFVEEADELLSRCQAQLDQSDGLSGQAKTELQRLLDGAKSRLSIINAHFLKGRPKP